MNVGIINFFSFLYKAGCINNTTCKIKKGKEIKNAANKASFKFEMKISGRAVKIILLFSKSVNKLISGFERILPTKEAL